MSFRSFYVAIPMTRVLIIGAGHAGGSAAALLRQYGHEGEVLLVGTEPQPPYQRPPLSKAWLKGETDLDALLLRPETFYAEQAIDLRTGLTAVHLDRIKRVVTFSDGTQETYDQLILAQGSIARRLKLPGAGRPELLELRTDADAERLKSALAPGRRLAIVGGGYVGLEVAASARALGAEVVVLEREPRVLARVASQVLSGFFTDLHRSHGVDIRTGVEISGFEPRGISLSQGQAIEADVVLVGVGALACDELARKAGLDCVDGGSGGVRVDEQSRTSDPAIFAVGDMTSRPVPVLGGLRTRLESVPNALEQAKQAAAAITGRPSPAPEVPWFWSDQYDAKLQIAGLASGADQQVVRGDPASGQFAVFHLSGSRIVSVEAVSAPAEFMAGRILIGRASPVDVEKLTDPAISMKAVGL